MGCVMKTSISYDSGEGEERQEKETASLQEGARRGHRMVSRRSAERLIEVGDDVLVLHAGTERFSERSAVLEAVFGVPSHGLADRGPDGVWDLSVRKPVHDVGVFMPGDSLQDLDVVLFGFALLSEPTASQDDATQGECQSKLVHKGGDDTVFGDLSRSCVARGGVDV